MQTQQQHHQVQPRTIHDSWIEIPSHPASSSSSSSPDTSDAEIITSGLRVSQRRRRPRHHHHHSLAETVLLPHPHDVLAASFSSIHSTSSTSSADGEDAEGVEDIAGYINTLPLSSSEEDSSTYESESGSEDEIPEEVRNREREEMRMLSDQALRASLNTLLSCAAAAAGKGSEAAMSMVKERESPMERSVEGLRVVQGDVPPPSATGAVAAGINQSGGTGASASGSGSGRVTKAGTASSPTSRTSTSPAASVSGDQSRRRKKSKKRQEVDIVMVVSLAAGAVVVVAAVGFAAFMAGGWVRREIAQDSVEAVLKEEVRRRGVRT
ncbi:hypothetical protein BZA77DRAFT_290899 [Pyronema omphalodes]|nr:hypothetical protein BZA77DRAFT_290899 [Pyronema omphalodes]